jgi:acetyl-CoA carboxylase carboxyltransferase component
MGARQAVDLVHRREIAAADDPGRTRDKLADRYAAAHLTAARAAEEGVIDEIVAPSATRSRLASALRTFSDPARPVRPARNIPL